MRALLHEKLTKKCDMIAESILLSTMIYDPLVTSSHEARGLSAKSVLVRIHGPNKPARNSPRNNYGGPTQEKERSSVGNVSNQSEQFIMAIQQSGNIGVIMIPDIAETPWASHSTVRSLMRRDVVAAQVLSPFLHTEHIITFLLFIPNENM